MQGPSKSLRILMVDDHADFREVMTMLLQLEGYTVKMATSGRSGLELLDQFRPDVVLLDIGLPEVNGFEVAAQIHARGAAPMLIAVSGFAREEDRQKARDVGFDAFLPKPFEMASLRHLLSQSKDLARNKSRQ